MVGQPLAAGLPVPFLIGLRGDFPGHQEFRELAALCLGFEGHQIWLDVLSRCSPHNRSSTFIGGTPMRVVALGALLVLAFATLASAQGASALAGTWERFSVRDGDGKAPNPQPPAAFLIMTPDGFFSQTAIPTGRPKVNKPLKD